MISDLKGLSDFMAWQTDEIPGPGYEFYTFWFQTDRLGKQRRSEKVKVKIGLSEQDLRAELELWVELKYPAFGYEDHVPVRYGWEE